ncbi:MAG TPA: YCF48-related protein [Blastocatellia bacterium]|nr:YCF48-related protein [Blastocatellia bacterium]
MLKQIRIISTCLWAACLLLAPAAFAQWQKQSINTDASFRGLCAVNENVAWVSGTKGTVGRTTDGGKTWEVMQVPDAAQLDFRDIEAFSTSTAYILSIGNGESSRIYKTTDGGKSWKLQFKNTNEKAFFDAMAFWDERHGIAMSDPVDGRFVFITTDDGGTTWKPISPERIPAALKGDGGFAASGTCLVTQGKSNVWLGSGGAATTRIYRSTDRGKTWTVHDTPVQAGVASAGIFSVGFRDAKTGIIVGGDYQKPNESGKTAAITHDGGKTWKLLENKLAFRSGIVFVQGKWIAVGPSGSDESRDNGASWTQLDSENYNAVSFTKSGVGWVAGPKGLIAKFNK